MVPILKKSRDYNIWGEMTMDNDILTKISGRNDIEYLYNKFGLQILDELRNDEILEYQAEIWHQFRVAKLQTEISFYEVILERYIQRLTSDLGFCEASINLEAVNISIKKYFLENIYSYTNSIFTTEVNFYGLDREKYFKKIGNDKEFYNNFIDKYRTWFLLITYYLEEETKFLLQFFDHLKKDYKDVMVNFFKSESRIENLKLSVGDRHRGKFVIEITSKIGHFYYKPRSGKVDESLMKISQKLTSNNSSILTMKFSEFLDRGDYSWYKKVKYKHLPPNHSDEYERYYKRMGQLLCLMYILNGGDIHYENIISYGEYPVVIDVEPLLTSRLRFKKGSGSRYLQNDKVNYIEDSVRNSLILPNVFNIKGEYFEFSPFRIYNGFHPNTPEDFKKQQCHLVSKEELRIISTLIESGFIIVYEEILNNKKLYIEFFEDLFNGLCVRYLNKPTDDYAKVKELMKNPVCFNNFKYGFAAVSKILSFPSGSLLIEEVEEVRELVKQNIPIFEIEAASKDLILSSGKILRNYFIESPIDCLVHKVNILCKNDLDRQIKIIKEMFFTISTEFSVNELYTAIEKKQSNVVLEEKNNSLESQLEEIFNNSMVNPITGQINWSGPELEGNVELREFHYRNIDYPNSYYTGSVGILSGILHLDNHEKYRNYVDKIIDDIKIDIYNIFDASDESLNIGAYNGLSQYIRIYIILYKKKIIDKNLLESQTKELLHIIECGIKNDTKLDILDGVAGVSKTIIELYSLNVSRKFGNYLFKLMEKCREHLINSIKKNGKEVYFPTEQNDKLFYTGYAHGTSGIIACLFKLSKILKHDDTKLIRALLDTERKLYDSSNRAWFKDNSKSEYCWGWCHGIPGILLSRVELFIEGYEDEIINREIRELYKITLEKSFGTNFTFCHGDLGNIVICKYVEEKLFIQNSAVDSYLSEIEYFLDNSKTYNIRGSEAPGLMHGLTGVISFIDAIKSKKLTSMIDILKITS